ncbi:MAG: aminopeptidase P family protein [Acholeplasmataceae bacterium]
MLMRRTKLIKELKEQSITIVSSGQLVKQSLDQYYPFFVDNNFYYLTNIVQENVYLVIIKGNNQVKTILFLEPFDAHKALWVGTGLSFEAAKKIAQVDEVLPINSFKAVVSSYLTLARSAVFGEINHLYFDFNNSLLEKNNQLTTLVKNFQESYPYLTINNLHPFLSYLRMFKDKNEINNLKKAIEITKEGILLMMKEAQRGMKEHELEAFFHYVLYKHGVRPAFKTIAASGVNATILHYENNNDVINDNELILFDLGASYLGYAADISRTFPISGKFTERQKQYYQLVLTVNKKVIDYLKPGVTNQEVNDYAKSLLAEGLIKMGKITTKEELGKYYYHSIGHFLGLDVHDVGLYTKPFQAGQVFTVEPGLYIKDENIGIRIEDDILITETGNINLSQGIIKEITEIEKFMKKK